SNGSERGNSLFSIGYFGNKGIVKETFNQKITARANADYSFFNNRLKIGENLSASYIKNSLVPVGDVMFTALVQQPIVPVHTESGGWGGPASGMTDRHNPVRLIEDNKQNKSHFFRVFGNAFADLEIIKNLHLRSTFGVDYDGTFQRTLRKSYVSGFLSDPSNQVSTSQVLEGNWIWQNTLNYNFEIDQSRFEVLAGSEQIKYLNQNFTGSRQGYVLENIDYSYLDAGSSNVQNGGIGSAYSLASFFGKINYSLSNKYLLSGTLRRDGSSRFGSANRYGVFPAFSAGWRLSEESFIKKSVPVISDLKIRYGWGKNGNQEIANNATNSLYSAIYGTEHIFDTDLGTAYDLTGAGSGQLPSGFVRTQLGNDSLKWESTTQSNIGVDFGLFDNKVVGSVDYFVKKTSDILINPGYLAVIGEGGNRWFNGASMQNTGWEVLLSYTSTISRDIEFTVTGNMATYRNKVTKLPEEVLTAYPGNGTNKTIIGQPINSRFGFIADGLFQNQNEVDNSPAQPGKGVGRLRFRDLNKDNIINDDDRDYIGKFDPDFTYGINFAIRCKNFDLSFFLQGVKGIDVYNDNITYTDFSSLWPGTNWGARVLDAWTPSNTGSSIPALTLVNKNDEGRTSTYYVENGSYLRLRNVQLSYTLRDKLKSLRFQSAQIFIQGSNLFMVKSKSISATDPESVNNAYPIPSMGTIGLNLTF
ncbi:MAG TPA: SusC/RagA family TonB-linked outer membrane protein, partial [Flavitalea sp.]|nr:SusC/RagA family TonB-linked outer membrane protein [Flavitalea sp.]